MGVEQEPPKLPDQKKPKNKKSKLKLKCIVVIVVAMLLASAAIAFFVLKGKSEKKDDFSVYVSPCLKHKETYNNLYDKYAQYDSAETIGQEAVDEYDTLISSLVNEAGSDEDPTCMYMVSELYAKKREFPNALYFIEQSESAFAKYQDRPVIDGLKDQMTIAKFKSYLEYRFMELKEYPQELLSEDE